MFSFRARILIIGINPYVLLPARVLQQVFIQAGTNKSPIAVKGTINNKPFIQTLVKYSGKWRLYINGPMLKSSGTVVGDLVDIAIQADTAERITPMPTALATALKKDAAAGKAFNKLPPYRQKEIMRYINRLVSAAAVEKNVQKAIAFLHGKERFAGRDKP